MASPALARLEDAFKNLSDEDRNQMRRMLTGEDVNDLIRREDVYQILRNLKTEPVVASKEVQKVLGQAMVAISKLPYQENTPS